MTLLSRRRVTRYVRKGILRELAFEDWADDDGVILSLFKVRDIGPVRHQNSSGRSRAVFARLESYINAAHTKER